MLKKIVRHGGAKAITINRYLLESIGVDPDGQVDMTIEPGRIVIMAPRPEKIEKALTICVRKRMAPFFEKHAPKSEKEINECLKRNGITEPKPKRSRSNH
jgi:antitoxin component of MazEF toxin-antitoxin module